MAGELRSPAILFFCPTSAGRLSPIRAAPSDKY